MSGIFRKSRSSATLTTLRSILKKPRILKRRSYDVNPTPVKVRFILLHAQKVQSILQQFVETKVSQEYENLLYLIRDAQLTEDDVVSLLTEVNECLCILTQELGLFVDAMLSINWTDKSDDVVSKYQSFIVNLISAHNYHAKIVIDRLVKLFLPSPSDPEWIDGVPSKTDSRKCVNIHVLLNMILIVVPLCKELLLNSISNNFPYINKSTHVHEYYLHNILWILEYQPAFRQDIFFLIFLKVIMLDVNAPKEEIEKCMNEDETFQTDDGKSMRSAASACTSVSCHTVAHTLDVCLDKIFKYVISECRNNGELNWAKTKTLYYDILTVFDKLILPTYQTHHVQFIMFLMCSFKSNIAEAFLNFLWKKVSNRSVPPVLKKSAINYIASLVVRANFVSLPMLKRMLQQMAEWIHSYISDQDKFEYVISRVNVHSVFYTVCQALFYVVSFRHKDFIGSKRNIVFLESLNMAKMVTSVLNPLKVCQPALVQQFAAITRKYQLAYCYTVMQHNSRNNIPIIYQNVMLSRDLMSDDFLEAFYPFDPFILKRSVTKIQPFYLAYEETNGETVETDVEEVTDVDDFLCDDNII